MINLYSHIRVFLSNKSYFFYSSWYYMYDYDYVINSAYIGTYTIHHYNNANENIWIKNKWRTSDENNKVQHMLYWFNISKYNWWDRREGKATATVRSPVYEIGNTTLTTPPLHTRRPSTAASVWAFDNLQQPRAWWYNVEWIKYCRMQARTQIKKCVVEPPPPIDKTPFHLKSLITIF